MQNGWSMLEKLRGEEQVTVNCEWACKPDVELEFSEEVTSHGKNSCSTLKWQNKSGSRIENDNCVHEDLKTEMECIAGIRVEQTKLYTWPLSAFLGVYVSFFFSAMSFQGLSLHLAIVGHFHSSPSAWCRHRQEYWARPHPILSFQGERNLISQAWL